MDALALIKPHGHGGLTFRQDAAQVRWRRSKNPLQIQRERRTAGISAVLHPEPFTCRDFHLTDQRLSRAGSQFRPAPQPPSSIVVEQPAW